MKSYKNSLKFLIILLLLLGIFFRFFNLDKKIYWPDEAVTSLRISGYTRKELVQQAFNGHEINIEYLAKFKGINQDKTVIDTIKSLAVEEPQLPPLYFVVLRFWVQFFGDSVAAIRSFSAFISLFAFPCMYWLCRELFESPLVGWVAIGLIAISPFHLLYAQEARPYSLWIVTILLSSAALLRAIRLQTKFSWGIYAVCMTLGLYSFLFSGFVTIGHGIYVFIREGFRLTKIVTAFMLSSLAGLLALTPWTLAIMSNFSKTQGGTNWASQKASFISLTTMWAGNISRLFIDFGVGSDDPLPYFIPLIPFILILSILVVYSLYFIYRHTLKQVWLFIFILIAVTALTLILADLIIGGRRSGVARYLIPCYLGIQIAVAYLLANKLFSFNVNLKQQKFWKCAAVLLFVSGFLSCLISSQAQIWWNKGPKLTQYNLQASYIINQGTNSLLLSDDDPAYILSLSYLLYPKVRLQAVVKPRVIKISQKYSDLFLYKPSDEFRKILENEYNFKFEQNKELGSYQEKLWQLVKEN
ncbi:MAG TPA: glycosyltransferase family 39 protein [Leptolyngbyaceae cyanobacterium]